MEFEILVFQRRQELEQFLKASDDALATGISRRVLGKNVLLITKKTGVAAEAWAKYRSAGMHAVCGNWVPVWNETKALHDRLRKRLEERGAVYIEVFRGENSRVIVPASAAIE
jgi:hypothetical protein